MGQALQTLAASLNVHPHRFVRTTEEDHVRSVRRLWKILWDNGDIYLGEHAGWYSVSDEAFYNERDVVDAPPTGPPDRPSPSGKVARATGKAVQWVAEANYMFRLSKYKDRIKAWLAESRAIFPEARRNDLDELLRDEGTFRDISVSRRASVAKWGIPVPGDASQIIYVWLDALTNYLTVSGFGEEGAQPSPRLPRETIHVIGKDILKFHAIYWPAFLMSAGLPLPSRIIVHGHWTANGTKMSKSLSNAFSPRTALRLVGGSDSLRYFLLRDSRLDCDADFSREALLRAHNGDLANVVGNLYSRALTPHFLAAFADRADASLATAEGRPALACASAPFAASILDQTARACEAFDSLHFHTGIERATSLLHEANRLFSAAAPWRLMAGQGEHGRVRQVLVDVAFAIVAYCKAMQHVMPTACTALLDTLRVPLEERSPCRPPSLPAVDLSALLSRTAEQPHGRGASMLFPRLKA